jgi:hypothetical protein
MGIRRVGREEMPLTISFKEEGKNDAAILKNRGSFRLFDHNHLHRARFRIHWEQCLGAEPAASDQMAHAVN